MNYKEMCNGFISLVESKRLSNLKNLTSTATGMADFAMARLSVLDEVELGMMKKFTS